MLYIARQQSTESMYIIWHDMWFMLCNFGVCCIITCKGLKINSMLNKMPFILTCRGFSYQLT